MGMVSRKQTRIQKLKMSIRFYEKDLLWEGRFFPCVLVQELPNVGEKISDWKYKIPSETGVLSQVSMAKNRSIFWTSVFKDNSLKSFCMTRCLKYVRQFCAAQTCNGEHTTYFVPWYWIQLCSEQLTKHTPHILLSAVARPKHTSPSTVMLKILWHRQRWHSKINCNLHFSSTPIFNWFTARHVCWNATFCTCFDFSTKLFLLTVAFCWMSSPVALHILFYCTLLSVGQHILSTFWQTPVPQNAAFIATEPHVNPWPAPKVQNGGILFNYTLPCLTGPCIYTPTDPSSKQ